MARLDHKLKSHGVKANEVKIMVIEHTVTPASNQGAPDDAPEFAPAPTTKKKELDHKHNTEYIYLAKPKSGAPVFITRIIIIIIIIIIIVVVVTMMMIVLFTLVHNTI